jgi:hypothetical protein
MRHLLVGAACCLLAALPIRSGAAFIDLQFGGATSFDGWVNLTFMNFPGYGSFPGSSPWPAPMESNEALSGDARLSRLAGGVDGGGPHPQSMSLYFGSYQQVANSFGGTLRVSDPTPLASAKTVVFQIQIGEADGHDFHEPTGTPVLRVNGSIVLEPFVTQLLNRYQDGTFYSPETDQEEPVYVNSWGFQWNVNGLGPITSVEIDFSGVTHSQIYRLRLDQAEALVTKNIFLPEFQLSARGAPSFDGESTSVTHRFVSSPDAALDVEFRPTLSGPWLVSPGPHTTGPDGAVDVVFTQPGDHRTIWARSMFFRAAYHLPE